MAEIQVGSRVRSFDFDSRDLTGERACFVEGVVEEIKWWGTCDRYVVRVDRQIFGGAEEHDRLGTTVMPPVNGTPTTMGRVTNCVEVIQ